MLGLGRGFKVPLLVKPPSTVTAVFSCSPNVPLLVKTADCSEPLIAPLEPGAKIIVPFICSTAPTRAKV